MSQLDFWFAGYRCGLRLLEAFFPRHSSENCGNISNSSSKLSVVCNSGHVVDFSRINHWKMGFRWRLMPVFRFCWFVRYLRHSSNHGLDGVQPLYANCEDEPLQKSLFTAQIHDLAELCLAFAHVLSDHKSSCKLEHLWIHSWLRSLQHCLYHIRKQNHSSLHRDRLVFVLPFFVGFFSYYKVFIKIRQHELDVGSSLQNSNNGAGRISRQEISISRVLSYVTAGFLICWVPMWGFIFWKRFSPGTAPRVVQLIAMFLLFLSSTINPFIYAIINRVFGEEFCKLLCWWKV